MKAIVPLCALLTCSLLAFLAHAAIAEKPIKAIEILHMPRFLFAGADLGFQVRVRGARDEDRIVFAMLCAKDGPCSLQPFEHERYDEMTIEGSAAARLWAPKPFSHVPPGEFVLIAGLAANGQIRVADALSVSVQGM